jgi:hypothetical protein
MDDEKTSRPNISENLLQLLPKLRDLVSIQKADLPERGQKRLEFILGLITELFESLPDNQIDIWRMPSSEGETAVESFQFCKWDRLTHQMVSNPMETDWIPEINQVVRIGGYCLLDLDGGLSRLILRGIIPALNPEDEHFLIFDIKQISGTKWETKTAALLDSIIETFLYALRFSDLIGASDTLDKLIDGGVSGEEISNAAQTILYLKARLNQLKNPADEQTLLPENLSSGQYYQWWNHPVFSIPLDGADDWVAAILVQTLISLATKPDIAKINQLFDLFNSLIKGRSQEEFISQGIVLIPNRGPRLILTTNDFRSWNSVSEALARLSTINYKAISKTQAIQEGILSIDLLELASTIHQISKANEEESKLWHLASKLTILSARAKFMNGAFNRGQISDLINDASEIAKETIPYLLHFLQAKDESGKIELSSDWLDVWLGYQLNQSSVLRMKNDNSNDFADYLSTEQVSELVYDWAIYFRHLLTLCKPEVESSKNQEHHHDPNKLHGGPDPEAIDAAKLNLICEWAHAQGVPRLIPLQKLLQTTYASELALYSLSSKVSHRQHLFHVQDACLLGCVLLDSQVGDKNLSNILAKPINENHEKLRQNWLVASLLHDIGYVLQVIPRGMDALGKETADAMASILEDIRKKLKQAPIEMGISDPTPGRSISRLDVENHAYVSVMTILRILDSLIDDGRIANDYNMALAAIIEHDVKDSYIDFKKDPLSGLIVICDELQDWGRPRLNAEILSKRFMSAIRRVQGTNLPPISLQSLNLSPKLIVSASWKDNNLVFEQSDTLEFNLKEHSAGEGGYEPAVAWLDICRSFQRIVSNETLPAYCITLQHKLANDGIPELKRLYAFARKDPSSRGGILDWVELVGKKNIDALIYHLDETNNVESLTFKVPKLGLTKPLVSIPSGLYREFCEFTRRG